MTISGYLSNQLGFSQTGDYVLQNLIKPIAQEAGIEILDPFEHCKKELDFKKLASYEKHEDVRSFWKEFSLKVTPINNKLMEQSQCMLALLDGGHPVDDGVAAEIGFYAAKNIGPIFALRSDVRLGENLAVSINPQVLGYIIQSGGEIFDGPNAIERWAQKINDWASSQLLNVTH